MPRLNLYLTALEDEQLTERADAEGLTRGGYVKSQLFPEPTVPATISATVMAAPTEADRNVQRAVKKLGPAIEAEKRRILRPTLAPRPAFRPVPRDEQVKQ